MSDPRRYSISIIENFSDKSLHEIAIIVTESIFHIKPDEFILGQTKNLTLGTEFLYTEELITWYEVEKELAPAFRQFPDTCFCVFVSDGENGSQYRTLFFNGKLVTQYPEIRYEEFRPNDFEYQTSHKVGMSGAFGRASGTNYIHELTHTEGESAEKLYDEALERSQRLENFAVEWDKTIDKVLNCSENNLDNERIAKICEMIESGLSSPLNPEIETLIRKCLYGVNPI